MCVILLNLTTERLEIKEGPLFDPVVPFSVGIVVIDASRAVNTLSMGRFLLVLMIFFVKVF